MAEELILSASQISTFLSCQEKWRWRYQVGLEQASTAIELQRGTAIHEAIQAHWNGGSAAKVMAAWKKKQAKDLMPYEYAQWADEEFENVRDIVQRYVKFYGKNKAKVLATEFELVAPVRPGLRIVGYLDLLVIEDGGIWPVEIKSSKSLSKRMSYLDVDSQITCYLAGMQAMGMDVEGVMFDGINTYPYKDRDSVEPEKLFRREKVTRNPTMLTAFWEDVNNVADQILQAQQTGKFVHHFGPGCDRCDFKGPCHAQAMGDDQKARAFIRTDYVERKGR